MKTILLIIALLVSSSPVMADPVASLVEYSKDSNDFIELTHYRSMRCLVAVEIKVADDSIDLSVCDSLLDTWKEADIQMGILAVMSSEALEFTKKNPKKRASAADLQELLKQSEMMMSTTRNVEKIKALADAAGF